MLFSNEALLKVDKVNAFYGEIRVLWDVSIEVRKGELVSILGSNGAGKSTLLQAIIGVRPPILKSGSITFSGKDITKLPAWDIKKEGISFIPEGRGVFSSMSVLENLLLGVGVNSKKEEANELLEQVYEMFPRLREMKNRKAGTLSGGERQMLVLGRSLIAIPSMIIIDEPSLGLDPKTVTRVYQIVRDIHVREITTLMSDQNIFYASEIADRIYLLESGRIVAEGTPKEVLGREDIKKRYLGL